MDKQTRWSGLEMEAAVAFKVRALVGSRAKLLVAKKQNLKLTKIYK